MIYEEFAPSSDLLEFVACFWSFALEASDPSPQDHVIPPDGTVTLAWVRPPGIAAIVGPRTEALRLPVQAGVRYCGARLQPGVAGPLLGISVPALRDTRSLLVHVAPERSAEFSAALAAETTIPGENDAMAGIVRRWAAVSPSPDPLVRTLVHRILDDDSQSVRQLAAGLNLSYRQLLRRFHEATGLTPKEFARLRRIRGACVTALEQSNPHWASVSAAAGYSDQSHLSREFNRFFGWPPSLVHEYLTRIAHKNVTP
jgi:AraC-like DNA-binding protein